MNVDTGLQAIGRVEWGTHFCHFYRHQADVADTLVPYFKTGLEANDACLWVTAEPFPKEAALAHLRVYFDDLDARISSGQLAVLDHSEWHERASRRSGAEVVNMWVGAKNEALDRGYAGLRLSSNTAFVRREAWDDFNACETAVRDSFGGQRILALCSYESDRWDSDVILDVVQTHDFALARRRSRWEVIESASAKRSKAALLALQERSEALSAALAQQQLLAADLCHRIKNSIASAQSLVDQSLRRARSPAEARASVSGRLTALARAHEQLAAREWTSANLRELVKSVAATFGTKVQIDVSDETLTTRATLDLSLVFHELMTNAMKYGALRHDNGSVTIRSVHPGASEAYTIVWTERGGPAVEVPTRKGFGTALAQQLITHDLRGECEFAFEPEGLRCTMVIPMRELIGSGATCMHGCAH
jgi:two-component system, sensor histidine kinase PdtaS